MYIDYCDSSRHRTIFEANLIPCFAAAEEIVKTV